MFLIWGRNAPLISAVLIWKAFNFVPLYSIYLPFSLHKMRLYRQENRQRKPAEAAGIHVWHSNEKITETATRWNETISGFVAPPVPYVTRLQRAQTGAVVSHRLKLIEYPYLALKPTSLWRIETKARWKSCTFVFSYRRNVTHTYRQHFTAQHIILFSGTITGPTTVLYYSQEHLSFMLMCYVSW